MKAATADVLIVGGGVLGLSIALAWRRRDPGARIVLLEKEPACGRHASGRNSGVLHAGFYYSADSLKARFTREGNRQLTEYCEARSIPLNRCGKLVVARGPEDLPGLDELFRRANANGVQLEAVAAENITQIEPRARTFQRAAFSPTTASVEPAHVIDALVRDATAAGIELQTGTAYRGKDDGDVLTSGGRISAGYVINTAGVYAERVARDFGFSERYRILPFKGLYLYAATDAHPLRVHLYPVPDLRHPFLGVHFTLTASGRAKIGPTAIPAFWREHYAGLGNFRLSEFAEIIGREAVAFWRDDWDFRALARAELRKYSRRNLLAHARELIPDVEPAEYPSWGPAGIRAQLVDIVDRRLEMDFRIEGDDRSMHVLNAVSPAFTCALPFSEFVCDRIQEARA